ncbi:type I secretion system permease/ATPase [Roseovarius salinarum]|uniref:type I secretion system permease/ATPase n=1 Tax=Roseovarius salinarum TaxID=1981892 RepID=UPI000C34E957|nr:type I secretion system permease/ATPase [Roseovarius salinarum]
MTSSNADRGHTELRAALRASRGLFWFVGIFSFFVNLLMLTGPLYMLQIYDRVLGSRSHETLIALSVLVVFLFGMMGLLDYARGRIMARAGARFQARMDRRVFDAVIRRAARGGGNETVSGLRDLESIQRLMSSPALMAVFDIPWTPFFLAGIWIFHPWLGTLAIIGGGLLVVVTGINQAISRRPAAEAGQAAVQAEAMADSFRSEAEMVRATGMSDTAFARWQEARDRSLRAQIGAADLMGGFTSFSKSFRLLLQSAMLGVGAFLVLRGELTPGAMIAGSILLGRALAPVEQAIGQWSSVQRALRGWRNLAELLGGTPQPAPRTDLPRPSARLDIERITVFPPGENRAVLRSVSFSAGPGQAIGVIGPAGAGKTTLARALTGLWPPAAGSIRLDGAALDQYPPEALGRYIGYLPQSVSLFDGTVAENIAGMAEPDDAAVVAAAKLAGAHEMILRLPDGYETRVSATGGRLSGGQLQRVGLARAVYGDPVVVVLDEPNSNLDNAGSEAVNHAIAELKAQDRIVLVMAHRPAAIRECDYLLALDEGRRRAFGPTRTVLRDVVQNHAQIATTGHAGAQ